MAGRIDLIQLRRGTAAVWSQLNPVLAAGEAGFESDTNKLKIGDGTSTWLALGYANQQIYIGDDPPANTSLIWIDTSAL